MSGGRDGARRGRRSDGRRVSTPLGGGFSATACIVRRVTADPRYTNDIRPVEVNDLIVDSITACARPVRAMIDAHDRMYGSGSGEAFPLGPYLDVLPAAVVRQVKVKYR